VTDSLPQRVPFPRPRAPYKAVPRPVLERYAIALRQWADAAERPGGGVVAMSPPPVTLSEALAWAEQSVLAPPR